MTDQTNIQQVELVDNVKPLLKSLRAKDNILHQSTVPEEQQGMLPADMLLDIPAWKHGAIAEYLETVRREDGSILFHDEVGTYTKWERIPERPQSMRPVEGSKVHHLLVSGDIVISDGMNADGSYKRVTLQRGTFLSVVRIVKGVPTVGQSWMPKIGL